MKNFYLLAVFLMISCCSPVYETIYHFHNPKTSHGIMCVNQCLQDKVRCNQNCEYNLNQCRRSKQLLELSDRLAYQLHKSHGAKEPYISKTDYDYQCRREMEHCKDDCEQYRRDCHINCGGQVTQEKRCVAFCN